jgi:hypothetical protein
MAIATGSAAPKKPRSDPEKQIDLQQQPKVLQPLARLARRLGVGVLATAFVLLILFMVAWYATPIYLRDFLNKRGSSLPDYKLVINRVQINPIACSIDLENIVLHKKNNMIRVPFFTSPDVHIAMQWTQLIHFDFRSNITLQSPVVNFVNGPTASTSQTVLEPAWVDAVKELVPLKINQFKIHHGDVHYYDFHAEPEINLELTELELLMDNLTNTTRSTELMPQTVVITGRPLKVGTLDAHLSVNVDLKQPTFAERVELKDVPAPALNSLLAKYGSVYAKSGNLAFLSEMKSEKGNYNGYMKPFFSNLQFEPMPKDRKGLGVIWASLVNGVKGLVENDKKVIATTVPVKGKYTDPKVDFWSAAFGVLKNAWIEALQEKFNTPEIAPGGKPPGQPTLAKPAPPRP